MNSKGHDYLPAKDGELLEWTKNLLEYAIPRADAWHLDVTMFGKVQELCYRYELLYHKAQSANRGKLDVFEKNETRDELKTTLRMFVRMFLANSFYVTNDDRIAMGIPIRKTTRTHAPVAHDAPDADADTSVVGCVTIHFFEKGHQHKKAKPEGQHGAEIAWVISDVPVTSTTKLIHSSFDTHTPLTLDFQDHDQRGQILYFALRWENTRGEKGPWSEIHSTVIP